MIASETEMTLCVSVFWGVERRKCLPRDDRRKAFVCSGLPETDGLQNMVVFIE